MDDIQIIGTIIIRRIAMSHYSSGQHLIIPTKTATHPILPITPIKQITVQTPAPIENSLPVALDVHRISVLSSI